VTRTVTRFNDRLAETLSKRTEKPGALLDMIAEFFAAQGNARLMGWLVLSGRTSKSQGRSRSRPLQRVLELAHAQRVQASPRKHIDYEDTKFLSQLSALALLGDAIFGDLFRSASGDAPGPESARDFRKRLAKLIRDSGS
jgi:hypothetical protein